MYPSLNLGMIEMFFLVDAGPKEGDEDKEEFMKCPICNLMYFGYRGLRHHVKRSHPEG